MTIPTPQHPADIVLHLIISFLTPLFLSAAGGDIAYARTAAHQTVNTYFARNPTDLLPIAQVIAFGLISLDSLGRSMNENLSTSLILRLRTNAVSLSRAGELSRRTLQAPLPEQTSPAPDAEAERQHEQALIADLARTERRIADAKAIFPEPPPTPDHTTLAACAAESRQRIADPDTAAHRQAGNPQPTPIKAAETASRTAWATAMNDVAREFTDGLTNLPPSQRRQATMRATALNSVAQHLLSNEPVPPSILHRNP